VTIGNAATASATAGALVRRDLPRPRRPASLGGPLPTAMSKNPSQTPHRPDLPRRLAR
jgi:hypothetical protein